MSLLHGIEERTYTATPPQGEPRSLRKSTKPSILTAESRISLCSHVSVIQATPTSFRDKTHSSSSVLFDKHRVLQIKVAGICGQIFASEGIPVVSATGCPQEVIRSWSSRTARFRLDRKGFLIARYISPNLFYKSGGSFCFWCGFLRDLRKVLEYILRPESKWIEYSEPTWRSS